MSGSAHTGKKQARTQPEQRFQAPTSIPDAPAEVVGRETHPYYQPSYSRTTTRRFGSLPHRGRESNPKSFSPECSARKIQLHHLVLKEGRLVPSSLPTYYGDAIKSSEFFFCPARKSVGRRFSSRREKFSGAKQASLRNTVHPLRPLSRPRRFSPPPKEGRTHLELCSHLQRVLTQALHLVSEEGRRDGPPAHLRGGRQSRRTDHVSHSEHPRVRRSEGVIHLNHESRQARRGARDRARLNVDTETSEAGDSPRGPHHTGSRL